MGLLWSTYRWMGSVFAVSSRDLSPHAREKNKKHGEKKERPSVWYEFTNRSSDDLIQGKS